MTVEADVWNFDTLSIDRKTVNAKVYFHHDYMLENRDKTSLIIL